MSPTRTLDPTAAASPTAAQANGGAWGAAARPSSGPEPAWSRASRPCSPRSRRRSPMRSPTPSASSWYRVSPGRAARARRNLRRVVSLARRERARPRWRRGPPPPTRQRWSGSCAPRSGTASRDLRRTLLRRAGSWSIGPARVGLRLGGRRRRCVRHARALASSSRSTSARWSSAGSSSLAAAARRSPRRWRRSATRRSSALVARGERSGHPARRPARRAPRAPGRAAPGRAVGIVGDRDIAGGGMHRRRSSAPPARLPVGPACSPWSSGRRSTWRPSGGSRGALPGRSSRRCRGAARRAARRARVEALLAERGAAFERLIALAPEQWWTVFFPIWPDLEARRPREPAAPRPTHRRVARRRSSRTAGPTSTSTRWPPTAPRASRRSSAASRRRPSSTSSGIADHERIDAALAARAIARARGCRSRS